MTRNGRVVFSLSGLLIAAGRRASACRSCATLAIIRMTPVPGVTARRVLFGLLLATSAAGAASAQTAQPPAVLNRERVQPYLQAVRDYRERHVVMPEGVFEMSREELKVTLAALRAFEPLINDRRSAPADIEWLDIEAAVLMHTELAIVAAKTLRPVSMEGHLVAAKALVDWLDQVDSARSKRGQSALKRAVPTRDWLVATLLGLSRLHEADAAADLATEAALRFPKDAEVLLAAGTVEELRAIQLPPSLRRTARTKAIDRLGQALKADPTMGEALLRQGRVLWQDGSFPEGAKRFERVLAEFLDDRLRYLAHLFLGMESDRRNRADDVIAHYRSAVGILPAAQAARTALAFALQQAGRTEEARLVVEPGLTTEIDQDVALDPFWAYGFGPDIDENAMFERLYAGVRR